MDYLFQGNKVAYNFMELIELKYFVDHKVQLLGVQLLQAPLIMFLEILERN